jgi:hypothetical protein
VEKTVLPTPVFAPYICTAMKFLHSAAGTLDMLERLDVVQSMRSRGVDGVEARTVLWGIEFRRPGTN